MIRNESYSKEAREFPGGRLPGRAVFARIAIALILLVLGSEALAAGTAANTQLQNTVTVNYDNIAGTPQTAVTASVTITVNLVQAIPSISINSTTPSTLTNIAEGQTVTVNYQVTSNSNGPDSYDLNLTESTASGFLSATNSAYASTNTTIPNTGTIATLGATTVGTASLTFSNTAGAGSNQCVYPGTDVCAIEVPNDGANNGTVNGIAVAAEVKINNGTTSVYCTVASVTDTNGGAPYIPTTQGSTITVQNCYADAAQTAPLGSTFAIARGNSIYQTTAVTVTYTMGTLSGGSSDTTTISVQAQTTTGSNQSAAVTTAITVNAPSLVIHKFVRNTSGSGNPASCPTTGYACLVANGQTYYASGVTANPGNTLEYAVLVENQASNVKNVVLTDPLVTFTSYVALSAGLIDSGTVAGCAGGTCTVTNTAGHVFTNVADDTLATVGDFGGINASTVTIYAGVGGDESAAAGSKGGSIAAGDVSVGFYQATLQ